AEHGPAGSLRAEASCPLCLGLFQDPVSIHCGHNFCRSCIERCWESSRESFPCPRCRETAPERSLRPNRELAKIIRIAQRLSLRGGSGRGERLCQRHGEALKLFCEQDQTPDRRAVCVVCHLSREHRAHTVLPAEEAAHAAEEVPQEHLSSLRKGREEAKAERERQSEELL
ncbi:TRI39 ligase, partial [Corvus moneduloides]|nr:TRI39 ligase [Corvus moneduloides]